MGMSLPAFVVTIGILVCFHEYGHFRAARACGIKVLRFSLGFGPVIWGRKSGETEYVVCAIPLGGYVRMLDEREAEVAPHERSRAFNRQPLWARAFVVAAGPLANLVLAVLLYAVVNWAGVQELRPWLGAPLPQSLAAQAGLQSGDEVQAALTLPAGAAMPLSDARASAVRSMTDLQTWFARAAVQGQDLALRVANHREAAQAGPPRWTLLRLSQLPMSQVDGDLFEHVGLSGPYAAPTVAEVLAGGPAQRAGLKVGDRVTAMGEQTVWDAAQLRAAIRASASAGVAQALHLRILRAGQALDVDVLPVMVAQPHGGSVARIQAGLGGPPAMVEVRYGLWEGLQGAALKVRDEAGLSLSMLGQMLSGHASLNNLSGPLTIADYAGRSAELGWVRFLSFLGMVSVSLGVLNLLPVPVLDGGHLMYYLFEGLTGRAPSPEWLNRLQRGGMAILLLMMSLALYNDVARLLGAH